VVSSNHQGLVEVPALAIQFLVAVLRVEHFVHNVEWHVVAHMLKAVLVNVVRALINAGPSLALVARSKDWLELSQAF
jgi:hypothetical protein